MNQKQKKRLLVGSGILFAVATLIALMQFNQSPPKVTDPSYYNGPMLNHRGDLVAPDGTILEKAQKPLGRKRPPRQ